MCHCSLHCLLCTVGSTLRAFPRQPQPSFMPQSPLPGYLLKAAYSTVTSQNKAYKCTFILCISTRELESALTEFPSSILRSQFYSEVQGAAEGSYQQNHMQKCEKGGNLFLPPMKTTARKNSRLLLEESLFQWDSQLNPMHPPYPSRGSAGLHAPPHALQKKAELGFLCKHHGNSALRSKHTKLLSLYLWSHLNEAAQALCTWGQG